MHRRRLLGARGTEPSVPPSSPSSSSFLDVPSYVVTGGRITIAEVWTGLQNISLQYQSPVSMLVLALSATIVNHGRRTLFYGSPWAGFFALRPDFADDWRVALARPDIYLDTLLASASLSNLAALLLSNGLWDITASVILGELAEAVEYPGIAPDIWTGGKSPLKPQANAVGFLVWLLTAMEASLAQSSAAIAMAWSLCSLLRTDPSLLMRIVTKQRLGALLLGFSMAFLILARLVPTVVGAAKNSRRGRPGALLTIVGIVGSLYTLLAYRSRLYIAIETSGLFVFLGTFAVSASFLIRAQRTSRRE